MTPHIKAENGDFAKTVLMPGDPLRAKYIAEHYLENAVLVNEVRGMLGYTGKYHGKDVSVMASGMGMPSMAIYSYELFKFFDVDNIIRIGTAGAVSDKLGLRDVVLAMSACTNSNFANQYGLSGNVAPTASFELLKKAYDTGQKQPCRLAKIRHSCNRNGMCRTLSQCRKTWQKCTLYLHNFGLSPNGRKLFL